MITIRNMPIPRRKINQFHEILCACGGYYLGNPIEWPDEYRVDFNPGDYRRFHKKWSLVTKDIIEIRKDTKFRKFFNRICGILRI
ncbi:MAG: hypothetical protein GF364_19255 [Candidatus Lokiarchaeota archaeon]|nr:hypothetical protein [Candidatus Lokiarchaeota archaeon]